MKRMLLGEAVKGKQTRQEKQQYEVRTGLVLNWASVAQSSRRTMEINVSIFRLFDGKICYKEKAVISAASQLRLDS